MEYSIVVELETILLFESPDLPDVYRLALALYDVGIPSYVANGAGDDLPSADEGAAPALELAGPPPFRLSIYPQDQPLAVDILAETFG